jgi:dynactin 1
MEAKFQELQSALVAAQRLSKDLQSENAHLETKASEAIDQLEMATLDREVAEEKAEAGESEVVKLLEKIAELEVEVGVLREENGE